MRWDPAPGLCLPGSISRHPSLQRRPGVRAQIFFLFRTERRHQRTARNFVGKILRFFASMDVRAGKECSQRRYYSTLIMFTVGSCAENRYRLPKGARGTRQGFNFSQVDENYAAAAADEEPCASGPDIQVPSSPFLV